MLIVYLAARMFSLIGFKAYSRRAGKGTDNSVNVEANLATRDNKKAVISHEKSASYRNKGDVTHQGVNFEEDTLSKLIWAAGLDIIIVLAIIMSAKVLFAYFQMRGRIITKKLELKMLTMQNEESDKWDHK